VPFRKSRSIPARTSRGTSAPDTSGEVRAVRVLGAEGVEGPVGVDEAPGRGELGERLTLLRGHVGRAREGLGVVHVRVVRGDVEVAHHHELLGAQRVQPLPHGVQELELLRERLGADGLPVDDVGARDAQPVHPCVDPARLVRPRLAREPEVDVGHLAPLAGEDRDAGPTAARVVHGPVARRRKLVGREGRGLGLRLLQAEHVGLVRCQELEHPWRAGLERVDVPGDQAHPGQATP
jgi:hypothetical protein